MGLKMRRVLGPSLIVCIIGLAAPQTCTAQTVQVASKRFTGSIILGEVATHWLRQADIEVEHQAQLGDTRFLWEALLAGEIDLYPDYTGTILRETLASHNLDPADLDSALASVGIKSSRPLGVNDTYVLGMKTEKAAELGIRTISDLNRYPDLRFGFSAPFMDRWDGWPTLRVNYDMPHTAVRGMDHDLSYVGIESGTIDVMDMYATDAEIEIHDLTPLEDDLGHFPEYQAVYLYRADLAERAKSAPDLLDSLGGRISTEVMRVLNMRVVSDGESETRVAADFLSESFDLAAPPDVNEVTMWMQLWVYTREHVTLVAVSLLAAILISIPLGIMAAKFASLGAVILGVVGVIYTIPSLALLVFMIPLLGVGGPPAVVALFLYSLLPIVRNTHAGLTNIPSSLREAAVAIGLERNARLWRVELPLAMPSIMAGVQTSAVINIGTATLGALIGAGGYGQPILTGIRLSDTGLILLGAVPAALMALAAQGLFSLIERRMYSPDRTLHLTG